MKILVRFNKNISTPRQVKSFKVFDLGVVTTTIDDLLDITTIEIDDQTLPVLKITEDSIIKYYLINDLGLTPGLVYPYYTDDFMKIITIDDLILINSGETGDQNVQADWNQVNILLDDYIKNKPTLLSQFTNDSNFVTTDDVKYIKSNEDLSLAKRVDDFLYGILDQYTGEDMVLKLIDFIPDEIDNVIYYQLGLEYFERVCDYVKPEWFGLDEVNDDIAINKAILSKNLIMFNPNKTYYTSNPIRSTKNKILKGNFCTIQSTSTTNIIEGIDELLSGSYHHDHCTITDFILKSNTAEVGINLKGFKYSNILNINLELSDTSSSTIGILLKHGATNNEQCYFNQVDNFKIYLTDGGTGILIDGTSGVSGANVNTISNGSVAGYDDYGVVIRESSVGNLIQRVDLESFEQSASEQIGFNVINSTQNTFIACHCETYRTAVKCDAQSFGNRIISLSHAGNVLISEDLGENIWEFVNSDGFYSQSIGKTNEGLTSGVQRVASYVNSGIRLDTTNLFFNQKNIGMYNGVGGFKFMRSNTAGGDPLTGTTYLELNDAGYWNFTNTLKVNSIIEYASNAAALGDGWTAGFVYRDSTGNLKIVY